MASMESRSAAPYRSPLSLANNHRRIAAHDRAGGHGAAHDGAGGEYGGGGDPCVWANGDGAKAQVKAGGAEVVALPSKPAMPWWWMSSAEQQEAGLWVRAELLNRLCPLEQQGRRRGVAGVADGQADNLGRKSPAHAEIEEVLVLGDQYVALLTGPCPDRAVTGAAKTDQAHMGGVREPLDQQR